MLKADINSEVIPNIPFLSPIRWLSEAEAANPIDPLAVDISLVEWTQVANSHFTLSFRL
jgi:hypothetical protein